MANLNRIVLGILVLQLYVHAAPSDVSKLEDIAEVEQTAPKLDSKPRETKSDSNSTESQRQKRWYNPFTYPGFGLPLTSPPFYPNFNRNEGSTTGFFGGEDPLVHIYRRLQEIANIVRQPPPPPPPQIPQFYPVLFVPTTDCRCDQNSTPPSDPSLSENNNNTTPSIMTRWPEMDDERQNWGFVVNETDEDDDDEDFSRPISFNPIRLNRPMRPAPPVEHGSVQSESTQDKIDSEEPISQPPPPQNASPPNNTPQNSSPPQNLSPSSNRPAGLAPPSPCDGAILSCCHQPQVYYDCFAIQGCPDFTAYANPCDPNLILRVIERFQKFYGQRTG